MQQDPEQSKVEEITKKCLDSGGYMIFTGCLVDKKTEKGDSIIEFDYRRYHFPLEDAKNSLKALRKFVDDELEKLAAEGDGSEEG
jgi:hypothetical protein